MAQLTSTALRNPVFVSKIRTAMKTAYLTALYNPDGHGKAYVPNRFGHYVLRVDYFTEGRWRVWGDLSYDVTAKVLSVVPPGDKRGVV